MKKILTKLQVLADSLWPANYAEYEQSMNDCCLSIALELFKNNGCFLKKGDIETRETLKKRIGYPDEAAYLVEKLLHILIVNGLVEENGGSYTCLNPDPMLGSPAEILVSLTRRYPSEGATVQWLSRAYGGMMPLLQGRAYPEDILFPWGDMSLIEELYESSPIYSYYSRLAGAGVKELIVNSPAERVELLEIGAGTGNGTASVLSAQSEGFSRYTYTDVSRSLVKKGKRRFKKHDFMDYKLFDITKTPVEQDFSENSYDLVAGINVLHASMDAGRAISNIHSLLKDGGSFVISEVSPAPNKVYPFMELTFGLIPSYNSYIDKESRPLSPLLPLEEWRELFLKNGFSEAHIAPTKKEGSCYRGGLVIGIK